MKTDFEIYKKDPSRICFSAEELWYLLNLYAPTSVIGIENPYTGKFVEEIRIFEQIALEGLLSRQIVHLIDKNSIEFMDTAIKTMIESCLKPEHCLWLTVSQNSLQRVVSQHLAYFSAAQIVDVARERDLTYWLTSVRDTEALIESLVAFLSPTEEERSATHDFILEQQVFDSAIIAFDAGNDRTGRELLSAGGINDSSIEELRSALGEEGNTMLAIFISNPLHPETCHTQGLGYLGGKMGGWLMHQYEQNGNEYVRFQPAKAKEFRELTFSLFR